MVTLGRRLEHRKPLGWPAIAANCAARFLLWSLFAYILCLSVVDVGPGKWLFSWHPPLLTLAVSAIERISVKSGEVYDS